MKRICIEDNHSTDERTKHLTCAKGNIYDIRGFGSPGAYYIINFDGQQVIFSMKYFAIVEDYINDQIKEVLWG